MKIGITILFYSFFISSCNILQDTDSTSSGTGNRCGFGEEINVLFIAESELQDSDIAQSALNLGCSASLNLQVSVFAPLDYNFVAMTTDNNLESLLNTKDWDFVFISEHSSLITNTSFDFDLNSLPSLISLKAKILALNSSPNVILMENWASADSFNSDNSLIQSRYNALGLSAGIEVLEVTSLWENIYSDPLIPFDPLALWGSDLQTPSELGEVLIGGLLLARITDTELTGENFNNPSNDIIYIKNEINNFISI